MAATQAAITAVLAALQIGLIMTVFAFMDYSRFFDINISMFIDNFMMPLFIALFIISIFWNLAFKFLP